MLFTNRLVFARSYHIVNHVGVFGLFVTPASTETLNDKRVCVCVCVCVCNFCDPLPVPTVPSTSYRLDKTASLYT